MFYFILLFFLASVTDSVSQNFWEQTNGPVGGEVNALIAFENSYILAGTSKGVFRSEDNGFTWNRCSLNNYVYSFASNSAGDIFAGVTGGLYRSNDNGINWSRILSIPVPITAAAVNLDGHIFAGSHISDNPGNFTLVLRSTDNGESWEKVGTFSTGLTTSAVATILVAPNGDIFVGGWHDPFVGHGGIYRSSDNGNSWKKSGLDDMSVVSFALDSQGDFFAGTMDGVFCSQDDGISWNRINGLDSIAVISFSISSDGELFAGTQGHGIFRLSGNNWLQIVSDLTIRGSIVIALNDEGDLFAGSSLDGIFRSVDNGQNFTQVNNGLIITQIEDLASNKDGDIFAATLTWGVFKSSDNGDSWLQTSLNNEAIRVVAVNSQGHIFAGGQGYSGFWRSTDSGANWKKLGLDSVVTEAIEILPNDDIFVGTNRGILRSINNGDTWAQAGFNDDGVIFSLAINSRNEIFAVVPLYDPPGIYRSIDDAQNWTPIGLTDVYSTVIAVNSNDYLFVGTSYDGGIYYSKDNGNTWQQTGLTSSSVSFQTIVFNEKDEIFAGSFRGGVYRSSDNGETWLQINEGLIEPKVSSLVFNKDGFLFAGTYGTGIFKSLETATSVEPNAPVIPELLILEQNYPNPFNLETSIQYRLPNEALITLEVYNLLGQKIVTLFEGSQQAGNYNLRWNGKNTDGQPVPSGIYFYRLQTKREWSQFKRMLLLK